MDSNIQMEQGAQVSRPIIVLTGGIASGKTTVARLLTEYGVPVIDADDLARELVEPGEPAFDEIVAAFGRDMLDAAGRLNRAALRARVFSTRGDRERLERILHPRITQQMLWRADTVAGPYCVLAIPLLLETRARGLARPEEPLEKKGGDTPWETVMQRARILVVDTPVHQQMQRACWRDGASPANVRAIILSQVSREERLAAAHDVITNDGNLEHLRAQARVLHHRYLEMARDSAGIVHEIETSTEVSQDLQEI